MLPLITTEVQVITRKYYKHYTNKSDNIKKKK